MPMKEYVKRNSNSKYTPYKDRLVLIVAIGSKPESDALLLTDRVMMALGDPTHVKLGSDGNGRFGIKGADDKASNAYKIQKQGVGYTARVACSSFVHGLKLPIGDRENPNALIYPANTTPEGWIESSKSDFPSRK